MRRKEGWPGKRVSSLLLLVGTGKHFLYHAYLARLNFIIEITEVTGHVNGWVSRDM